MKILLTNNALDKNIIAALQVELYLTAEHYTMQLKTILAMFSIVWLALMEVTWCQKAMLAPPERPAGFRNPRELKQYLRALNDYYSIVGRPR